MYISNQDYIPEIQMRILHSFNIRFSIQNSRNSQLQYSSLFFIVSIFFALVSISPLTTHSFCLYYSLYADDRTTNTKQLCIRPLEGLYFCRVSACLTWWICQLLKYCSVYWLAANGIVYLWSEK